MLLVVSCLYDCMHCIFCVCALFVWCCVSCVLFNVVCVVDWVVVYWLCVVVGLCGSVVVIVLCVVVLLLLSGVRFVCRVSVVGCLVCVV